MGSTIAIIFDMDDTLVKTAGVWRQAEARLLESLGANWTEELARRYKGMNALDVAATIHGVLGPAVKLEECQRRLRTWLLEGLLQGRCSEMPGASDCVRRLAKHAPIAVASGSPLEAIEALMQGIGVRQHISTIISSEEVGRGKPSPDVFLAAAQRLGADSADCVVIEDSLIGVRAAFAAKMGCLAVPSGSVEEIRALGAGVFSSLRAITWPKVQRARFPGARGPDARQ